MEASDWIAIIALIVSSGALFLEVRRWFEEKPRLKLSVMRDAIEFPDDDGKPKLALTVVNRGNMPTTLTHMVAFLYKSRWHKWRRKSYRAGLVNSTRIPAELGVNKNWIGMMLYEEDMLEGRNRGELYVGVIAAHSDREFLVHVPAKEKTVPKRKIKSE